MKKVMAMVLTVAMLLTCFIALPVSAATESEEVNLIVNSSFEASAESVEPWVQTGTNNLLIGGGVGQYIVPADDGGTQMVYTTYDTSGAQVTGIKQTVTLEGENEKYYTNQALYEFDLYFRIYYGRGTSTIDITLTAADGVTTATKTYTAGTDFAFPAAKWATGDTSIDITEFVDSFTARAKTITVELKNDQEAGWDNIRLVPTYNEYKPVKLPIVNGSFEADAAGTTVTETTGITGWTADSGAIGWVVKEATGGLTPTDGTKMIHYPKVSGATSTTLRQEIEMPSDADYYANVSDYTYTLSFSGYYIVIIDITVKNADKSVSATTRYTNSGLGHSWSTKTWDFDISDAVVKTGKPKYIEIALMANTVNHESGIDNVKITATKKAADPDAPVSILANGGFENVTEEGALESWTPLYATDYGVYELIQDVNSSPGGYNHVKLTSTTIAGTDADGNSTSKTYGGILNNTISVEEGKYYKISFKYKAGDESALVEIANPANWSSLYSRIFKETDGNDKEIAWSTAGWVEASALFKASETADVQVALRCYPGRAGVYYEDISVTEHEVNEENLTQSGNLLVNGSFEEEAVGAYGFIGWTETRSAASTTAEDSRARDGQNLMIHGFDDISQTVEINDYDYVNGKNYGYNLDFSYGSYSGGGITVKFDLVFEDGDDEDTEDDVVTHSFGAIRVDKETGKIKTTKQVQKTDPETGELMVDESGNPVMEEVTEYTDPDLTQGFPHVVLDSVPADISIDIGFLTEAKTTKLKSITITLPAVGTPAYLDDFKLYANDKSEVVVVDAEGNEVAEIATADSASYTAKAKYYGEDTGAMVYLAVYKTGADGNLRLVSVVNGAITGDGTENTAVKLEGVNATAGNTVVKAFVWSSDLQPVASTTVD